MKTYQDLIAVPKSARGAFCREAVEDFKKTAEYERARAGMAYYAKHNITIEKYQKLIQTVSGRSVEDFCSANYKLKTLFFRRLVIQQVQYVLGNGVTFANDATKEKLGKDFDFQLQKAAKWAMAGSRAHGFWNMDHLEVFGYADTPNEPGFCPLYDEETAELRAGIRYWFLKVGNDVVFRCTLYEEDGFTGYRQNGKTEPVIIKPKRAYRITKKVTPGGEIEEEYGENYTSLPIVPLFANDTCESELVGIRESIDCYDLIKSGMANDIDDLSGFFWTIENSGGMDDFDLARFVQRMKTVRAAAIDADDGAKAEAHTQEIPVNARSTMLNLLRADIYDDFQALDVKSLSAAAKTAQEIQAAYQPQDNKCADFEYYVLDFVQKILELAGIDDNPTFVWNKVTNMVEQTNMVLNAANYMTDEAVIKHLPFLTPEEADQIIKDRDKESMNRFTNAPEEAPEEEPEEDEER